MAKQTDNTLGGICVCALIIIVKFGAKMIGITSPRYLSVYLSSGAYADNLVDAVDQLLMLYQKKNFPPWSPDHYPESCKFRFFPLDF